MRQIDASRAHGRSLRTPIFSSELGSEALARDREISARRPVPEALLSAEAARRKRIARAISISSWILARQELPHALRDLLGVRFQREMSRVEELNYGGRIVVCEGLRASRQEKGIVLPPYGQKRRFICPKVLLEGRVERNVALVVTEEIQLNFIRSGSCEVEVVEILAVGRDKRRVHHSLRVLPARRLGADEGSQCVAILFGRLLPICTNRIPAITEPFLIGVPVL